MPKIINEAEIPKNKRFVNNTSKKIGRLFVLSYAGKIGYNRCWNCICECGNFRIVSGGNLASGHTTSCGCANIEKTKIANFVHGKCRRKNRTKEYIAWGKMKQRCGNPKDPIFKRYGGRGISVCDKWKNSFFEFFKDMGKCPPGKSIDRIDVNGNYEPGNCRWATATQQARNKEATIYLSYNGEKLSILDWADRYGIPHHIIHERYKKGWPVEKILLDPFIRKRK